MKVRYTLALAAICILTALTTALGQPGPGQVIPPTSSEPLAVAAKEKTPPFAALLLLVKSDWSKVPAAKEIEAELREALKDASIPQPLLDKLPASGPQILFAPEIVSLYKLEHFSQLVAWLRAKGLLEKVESFPAVKQFEGTSEVEQPYYTLLRKTHDFIDIPWQPQLTDQPFITRRPELHWEFEWQGKSFVAVRSLSVVEQVRGEAEAFKKESLGYVRWEFDLPSGQAAVMNAFPGRDDEELRNSAHFKGFEAVLVVARGVAAQDKDSLPLLNLPLGVKPLTIMGRTNSFGLQQRTGSRGLSGGGRRTPGSSDRAGGGSSSPPGSGDGPSRNTLAPPTIKVFALVNAKAAAVAKIVGQLFPGESVNLAVDERTNSIIATGTEEVLAPIEALLVRLDQPTEGPFDSLRTTQPAATGGQSPAERYRSAEQEAADTAKTLREMLGQPNRSGRQIEELRALLKKKVTAAFAARQQLLKFELTQLQDRMRDLGETIEARNRIGEQIIDRRVQDLLHPDMRWDSGGTPAESSPIKSQRSTSLSRPTGSGKFDSGGVRSVPPLESERVVLNPTLPFAPTPSAKALSDNVAPTAIWDQLGLKLEPVSPDDIAHRFRGGLRVVELKPEGPATGEGLLVGDVLIGLHVWETISLDNALFALSNLPRDEGSSSGGERRIKYFILRKGQAMSGYLPLVQ